MAIEWGDWEDSGGNGMRVGVELSVSGTRITVKYWRDNRAKYNNDTQKATFTGDITGDTTFTNDDSSTGQLIATKTKTGSRGHLYTFGVKISGANNGVTPSAKDSIRVPPEPPSAIRWVAGSAPKNVDEHSAYFNWDPPSDNGGAPIDQYQTQIDRDTSFSTPANYTNSVAFGSFVTVTVASANQLYYARTRAHNEAGWGPWSSVRSFTTTKLDPAAVTGLTITRNSDASFSLNWTNHASSGAPYDSILVQRSTDGAAWATVTTLSGAATSYVNSGTSADHRYQWRIVARNTGGQAIGAPSAMWQTTPAAPTQITAVKDAGANIVVKWKNNSRLNYTGTTWEVSESSDAGANWTVKTSTLAVGTTTYTHVAPSTVLTHRYRVRLKSAVGVTLYSAYVTSSDVQLPTAPYAPTNLKPTTAQNATLATTFTWVHSSLDTAPQTAYQFRHRAVGSPTWTTLTITSPNSLHVLPANTYTNGVDIEWQVATKGLSASYGPFSASAVTPTGYPPTATLETPWDGSAYDSSQLVVTWGYYDTGGATAQTAWVVRLLSEAGVLLETKSGSDETSVPMDTALQDGLTYTVEVYVQDADGMWNTDSPIWAADGRATFHAQFDPVYPAQVNGLIYNPDTGSVEIQIMNLNAGDDDYDPNLSARVFSGWQDPGDGGYSHFGSGSPSRDGSYEAFFGEDFESSSQTMLVKAGEQDLITLWVRGYGRLNEARFVYLNAGMSEISNEDFSIPELVSETDWVQYTWNRVIPATATSMQIRMSRAAGEVGLMDWTVQLARPTATVVRNQVWRRVAVSTLDTTLNEGIPWELGPSGGEDITLTDFGPTVNGIMEYQIDSFSAQGAMTRSEVFQIQIPGDVRVSAPSVWLNGGLDLAEWCRGIRNIQIQASSDRAVRRLQQYAGRVLPVETVGSAILRSWQVSLEIITPSAGGVASPAEDWLDLAELPSPFLLRSPDGLREWVSVSGMSTARAPGGARTSVSFTATRVDH